MTPQTAAALRALVTKWNEAPQFPDDMRWHAGYRQCLENCARELAAVLTQEGADKCRQCGGTGQVDDTDCNTWPCPWCKAAPAEPRAAEGAGTDPDSGRHGPNENRHDVLKALGGSLTELYPQYELWRFERLAKDGL